MPTRQWIVNNKDKVRASRRKYYHTHKVTEQARIYARIQEIKLWLDNYKKTLSCSKCPENHPACLDFHHRNPKEKEASISQIATKKGWGMKKIIKEISKCDVLCANCHRKLHYRRGV